MPHQPFLRKRLPGVCLASSPRRQRAWGTAPWTCKAASLLLVLVFGVRLHAAERTPAPQAHQQFVIGLSPYLERNVKDDVYRGIVRLLVEDLPLDSSLTIYDAFQLKSLAEVNLPNLHAFTSPKTRANQFAPAIQSLKLFLAQEHTRPTNSALDFRGSIRMPQFCQFLLQTHSAVANAPLPVLLIGSPLYQDAKEPAFSMVDGYFPSDGHLLASTDQSIFGLAAGNQARRSLMVHWAYLADPWLNDLHREKVTRFWSLFLQRRGGQLRSFSGDLPTVLRAFTQLSPSSGAALGYGEIDAQATKIEMLRVSRHVDLTDWITRESLPAGPTPPPATMVGQMKIGIRWRNNIDLDLYATARPGAQTLFFQHPRSPEGYYYKDHRASPGREYEFIEFETPVDVRKVEAFVNFYRGSCPGGPRGEVRIEFDGRIYSGRFALPAAEGNRGRSGPEQEDCWTRLPILELLKISPAG